MSTEQVEEKPFSVDRAKQGRASCKKCKGKCPTGELRIAKLAPNPFAPGKLKNWYHVHCMFEQFLTQRVSTKRIESLDDVDGWDDLNDEDQKEILKKLEDGEQDFAKKHGQKYSPKKFNSTKTSHKVDVKATSSKQVSTSSKQTSSNENTPKDSFFREFRRLVTDISNVDSYNEKTNIVKNFFSKGSDNKGFKGNLIQWCRLLLPGVIKRIYNIQNKQLIKLFSKMFNADQQKMTDYLNHDDIGETIQHFFNNSSTFKPSKKSELLLQDVDDFLEELSTLTKADDQLNHFQNIARKCTANDLKVIVRLVKHDLRMNAGAKHILQGVHPDAYEAYQASRDLSAVIKRFTGESSSDAGRVVTKPGINVMTPIQPMLANACKSVQQAMKKCPNGMYSEIKYDGERVQVHKQGSQFKYFSRSLKPVAHHKVAHFEKYIPEAFPKGTDLVLDSEILMIDNETGQPLPFGTLGSHKKSEFENANVCLFVFDCIYYNGESLIQKPLDYRKQVLKENMTVIKNRVVFAEFEIIQTPKQLSYMIAKVLQLGLEGLVLKDIKSIYEPGKRHWLKVKKDYLLDGSMADTADLIVLGAWYGTGRKTGMKSVFLMGCYDNDTKRFCTVTKVHTGHNDKMLQILQKELQMTEIGCDSKKVPGWLNCNKSMIPDFVALDPKKQPVWEITGAEFTQHDVHTADGISIRFPRVTRIRNDKTWETATTLQELRNLFKTSKESTDYKTLLNVDDDFEDNNTSPNTESKHTSTKRKLKAEDSDDVPSKVQKTSSRKLKAEDTSRKIQNTHNKKLKTQYTNDVSTNLENVNKEIDKGIANKTTAPELNLFKEVQLLVENGGEKMFHTCLKYFIACGGTVLHANDWIKATHVLHLEYVVTEQTIKCPKHAHHIVLEWIKHCITDNKLLDVTRYTVQWVPK